MPDREWKNSIVENRTRNQAEEHVDKYKFLSEQRRPIAVTLGKLFVEVLSDYVDPKGVNVEIGSGSGSLNRLIERSGYTFIEFDKLPFAHEKGGSTGKKRERVVGDIFKMGFADGSVDSLVGLNMLTVIFQDDISQALREIHRVLKQGGTFVHLIDVLPKREIFLVPYLKQGILPIPYIGEDKLCNTFFLVPRDDLPALQDAMKDNSQLQGVFGHYLQSPIEGFLFLMDSYLASPESTNQLVKASGKLLESLNQILEGRARVSDTFNNIFRHFLEKEVQKDGLFELRESGVREKKEIISATDMHTKEFPEYNNFEHNVGIIRRTKNTGTDAPPDGYVKVHAGIQVLVLQKK
ncbi:MAG: hypothetical protein A3A33_04730 [Candidatus Yanofskybacteria bacterium RIFCSPLOWO2_01_FULL_49_25]|uniref:Methyltransferase type 11 domain-containing protein n=1 Tax=Candidatus Yanofskybacteria bacterium RIFCSPLOWO2_01_FULL_49_25 TaxID=1802701 RepID=A0A1F8GQ91_9BACT|nr:MAG: hypothetical protein A3A33_04730 [Candidatus Yanofskybacteria bacterium RIFCSPLOWO2_01_FULL_49_25]